MLKTFYYNFGFIGSILIALTVFLLVIFWISAIAGISQIPDSKYKHVKLFFAAIFPPYALLWLLIDVYQQHEYITKT
jgi:hypothetical protein